MHCALTESEKRCRAGVVVSDSNKFLRQTYSRVTLGIDEQANGTVQRQFDELVDTIRHCGGEQHGLSRTGTGLDDLFQLVIESSLQHTVSFVDDQNVEGGKGEGRSVVKMVDKTTWCCNEDVG